MEKKEKKKTHRERVTEALAEIEHELMSFELNGKTVHYACIEELELMYAERLHAIAIADLRLKTDADKEHYVKAYTTMLYNATQEAQAIMKQLKFEQEREHDKERYRVFIQKPDPDWSLKS